MGRNSKHIDADTFDEQNPGCWDVLLPFCARRNRPSRTLRHFVSPTLFSAFSPIVLCGPSRVTWREG